MIWQRRAVGRVGPGGIRGAMPTFRLSYEQRMAEGWDAVVPVDENEAERPIDPTPAQVTRMLAALRWPADILVGNDLRDTRAIDMSRAVSAACQAEAYDMSFARLVRERGIARVHAYTLRDRGLSIISQRLTKMGVPAWPDDAR
ncbi:hypothetical protein SAMN05444339_10256 [Loktanella atrilutea]|uniref:Uncharacterized protein n=2 Tax=Loktanella atrilutea TaxID=366533 RepID=A0A1M4WBD8_LOKAT|nr:hypothetical protein SAMN05444339_10256 [Loktanella atrilutea]